MGRELSVVAAYGGPPSVAHAEALLRGVSLRGTRLDHPLDAIVVPVPWEAPSAPRHRQNPVTASVTALGTRAAALARRVPDRRRRHRRDPAPARPAVGAATEPYRDLLAAARAGDLTASEADAARDERALKAYRDGRACHPLLPYREWDGCRHAIRRLGAVVVAGRPRRAGRPRARLRAHARDGAGADDGLRPRSDAPRVGFLVGPALIVGRG